MPIIVFCIIIILTCIITYFYDQALLKIMSHHYILPGRPFKVLFSVLKSLIILFCLLLKVPLLLVFLFYLIYCLGYYWGFHRTPNFPLWFWVHLRFIHFAAPFLMILSFFAILTTTPLGEVYQNSTMLLFALFLCVCLQAFAETYAARRLDPSTLAILLSNPKWLKNLIVFGWFCLVYLLFDSIPVLYILPYQLISLYMLGSSFLLLLQYYLFLIHTFQILLRIHFETEYFLLEAERTNRIEQELKLHNLAYLDTLTGVYTRRFAIELLESLTKEQRSFTIAYIDLNGLKKVNDQFGHLEGDRYLIMVTRLLNQLLRKSDVLARMGGDEFLILCTEEHSRSLEDLLMQANSKLQGLNAMGYTPSFSYGVTELSSNHSQKVDELLLYVDKKMYRQKHQQPQAEREGEAL